ncbi:MAG: hypothetical protein AAFX06_21635 [Planctomycetota bacterium]
MNTNLLLVCLYLLVPVLGILSGYAMFKSAALRRASRDRLEALMVDEDDMSDDEEDVLPPPDPNLSPFATRSERRRGIREDGNPYRSPRA